MRLSLTDSHERPTVSSCYFVTILTNTTDNNKLIETMKIKILESNWTFYILLFLLFFVFFFQIHPLVPFNSDDWINMGMARRAYPSFAFWNPTKVFPECFEPFVASFAAFFVTPLIGDYLNAMTITNAAVVSLFIIIYLYSFQKLLEHKFTIRKLSVFSIVLLFAILHFVILKTEEANNEYLLYSHDCNCYYHYTIPNLLCASLVMWLMRCNINTIRNRLSIGILCFVSYLALCSNLYSTIILTAYLGSVLLIDVFQANHKEPRWIVTFVKHHWYSLLIILLWFIVQLIEVNGRRATSYGHLDQPLLQEVELTFNSFLSIRYNIKFILFILFITLGTICVYFVNEKKRLSLIGKTPFVFFCSLIISITYLILLSSRVSSRYILRGDVIFGYSFFLLLPIAFCICYLCEKIKYFKIAIPCFIVFALFELNSHNNVFKDIQFEYGLNAQSCLTLDKYIINRVCEADAQSKDTVIIQVPKFNDDDNWPLSIDLSKSVGTTLYKHNITRRNITTLYEISE